MSPHCTQTSLSHPVPLQEPPQSHLHLHPPGHLCVCLCQHRLCHCNVPPGVAGVQRCRCGKKPKTPVPSKQECWPGLGRPARSTFPAYGSVPESLGWKPHVSFLAEGRPSSSWVGPRRTLAAVVSSFHRDHMAHALGRSPCHLARQQAMFANLHPGHRKPSWRQLHAGARQLLFGRTHSHFSAHLPPLEHLQADSFHHWGKVGTGP